MNPAELMIPAQRAADDSGGPLITSGDKLQK